MTKPYITFTSVPAGTFPPPFSTRTRWPLLHWDPSSVPRGWPSPGWVPRSTWTEPTVGFRRWSAALLDRFVAGWWASLSTATGVSCRGTSSADVSLPRGFVLKVEDVEKDLRLENCWRILKFWWNWNSFTNSLKTEESWIYIALTGLVD